MFNSPNLKGITFDTHTRSTSNARLQLLQLLLLLLLGTVGLTIYGLDRVTDIFRLEYSNFDHFYRFQTLSHTRFRYNPEENRNGRSCKKRNPDNNHLRFHAAV